MYLSELMGFFIGRPYSLWYSIFWFFWSCFLSTKVQGGEKGTSEI